LQLPDLAALPLHPTAHALYIGPYDIDNPACATLLQ
jgi:hypothetical protein